MSLVDTRNNSALFKRAEQLKRWEQSPTNLEDGSPKSLNDRKIKFSLGCVFLAACMAGDKEEVVRLLEKGADIDTNNIDGLTALHQACIDDNLDMVEFLVEHGADINRADNEGWTPLHATSSCGFVSIARYLIENDAELDLVNSDGELAIDLAASNGMENMLRKYIDERQIDCDEARQSEEKLMLADAKKWLRSDAAEADKRHPRTGATALHVASAKGYTKVLSLLLAGRANVDQQDNDGWTPLHAAAHWGQLEAAQMLVTSLADIDIKNYAGQTAMDVADQDVVRFLDDMKKKKNKRRPGSQLRINDSLDITRDTPAKVIRVEAVPNRDNKDDDNKPKPPIGEPTGPNDNNGEDGNNAWRRSNRSNQQHDKNSEKENQQMTTDTDVILRRTHSFENDDKFYQKLEELRARIKTNSGSHFPPVAVATTTTTNTTITIPTSATCISNATATSNSTPKTSSTTTTTPAMVMANLSSKTSAMGTDKDESGQMINNNNNIHNNNRLGTNKLNNNMSNQINCVQRSASLKDHRAFRPNTMVVSPPSSPVSAVQQQQQQQQQSANPTTGQIRRSFVPPVRDEESETQRKAHAKRVRETRRSTQGVTLDEIKSAEEMVKKKNLNNNGSATDTSDIANEGGQQPVTDDQQQTPQAAADTTAVVLRRHNRDTSSTQSDSDNKQVSDETQVSFTISSPGKRTSDVTNSGEGTNAEHRLSASYTLPKRQSSSANASPVPFYKNYQMQQQNMQNQQQQHSLSFNVKMPGPAPLAPKEEETVTLSLAPGSVSPRSKKSSLFEQDNANSLSLADKLRNEANKYTELSASNKSLNSIVGGAPLGPPLPPERTKREIITGSTQSLNDSVQLNNQAPSATATKQHQYVERRPSWRLKFDVGSKFKLEDAQVPVTTNSSSQSTTTTTAATTTTTTISDGEATGNANASAVVQLRRPNSLNNASNTTSLISTSATTSPMTSPISANLRPVSAPFLPHQNVSPVENDRLSSSINNSNKENENINDDKDNDKENENRTTSGQATQGVIQRRRRPKRRSTGVVHVDLEDLEGDREAGGDGDDKESGAEESRKTRLGSEASTESHLDNNGEFIDYKALYEACKAENDKLKDQLRVKDDSLTSTKAALERFTNATTKNSLSELEKRERRAMERKMSEMEEELKQLEVLKTENQRLKDENGALIRVISKLSK